MSAPSIRSVTSDSDPLGRMRPLVATVAHRLPFTTATTAMVVLAGLLWGPVAGRAWFPLVGFGVPALEHGRWWTPLTGAFLALAPAYYLPMATCAAVMIGLAEWRLGSRRAAAVTAAGHAVGVAGAVLVLMAGRAAGWPWAVAVAGHLDVGISGGAMAALAVASATLDPTWRLRVRAALCLHIAIAFLCVGSLADLVHLIAVGAGLATGRRLARPAGVPAPTRPGRREWRLAAALGITAVAITTILVWLLPSDAPLGPTADGETSWPDLAIVAIAAVLLGNGLRRGRRTAWRWAVGLAILNVTVGIALPVVAAAADVPDGVPPFVPSRLLWAGLLVVLIAGRRAFPVQRRGTAGRSDPRSVADLLHRWGGSTLSWMATWPGNIHFHTRDGSSAVAYQVHAGVAIAVGDPVGPAASSTDTLAEFARMAERSGTVPALFSVTEPTARAAADLGWRHVQVAEDTIVDLPELEFRGKSWQDVRSALNKAGREGITFRLTTLADETPERLAQLREISGEWAGEKGLPEMGFTLGGIDEALDPNVRVGIAEDADGTIHGVTSWLPVHGESGRIRGWTLDVMRRRRDGFRPVVEFLIASSCLAFRGAGAEFVSLSGAPLARSGGPSAATLRLLDRLGTTLEPLYGFRSLQAFKDKFHPRHAPLYLAYRDEADLPRIGIALTRAYLPGVPARDLVQLARGAARSTHRGSADRRPHGSHAAAR
jgi:Phosphatidylglycerol lysyltransferase, C-terminal